ncbi:unnamed protein product [Schistosoma margrebowiei]|uniref:Uncharacterized protein n=1 Tax=Schistosoma margrebowiei TaxID=48269 RepID=A0A183MTF0_9TREM|nr:unnamed protein product [Schistosoma margrebowiei]
MQFTKTGTSLVSVCPVSSSTLLIHENILNVHSHDREPDTVLIDADFSKDPLLCNDILNKFEETISEESSLDVMPNIISRHNSFVSCGKLVQYEARVLNELHYDYNSDDFISTTVYPYRKVTSNTHSNQCEKYVLNEATLFINWGYKDPTLFVGEDSVRKSVL